MPKLQQELMNWSAETLCSQAAAVRGGKATRLQILEAHLDRIGSIDATTRSTRLVLADTARAETALWDGRRTSDFRDRMLDGVPIGVKDLFDVAGTRTIANSRSRQDVAPATKDAEAVAAIRKSGAIVIGKHVLHELAVGGVGFDYPDPPAANPWDLSKFTGGSSSGSAAATSARLCAAALTTDTAGSTRIPAAYCGLAGFKPTFDRISLRGCVPLAPSLDTIGIVARTVADVSLVLAALCSASRQAPAQLPRQNGEIKIGRLRAFEQPPSEGLPKDLECAFERAIQIFVETGASVESAELPDLADFHACCMVLLAYEAFETHEALLAATPELFGRTTLARLTPGGLLTPDDYKNALRWRDCLSYATEQQVRQFDVLVCPTTWGAAPPLAESISSPFLPATPCTPFNVAGLPALSIPIGRNRDGMPIGLQIVGHRGFDEELLAIASRLESSLQAADVWSSAWEPDAVRL